MSTMTALCIVTPCSTKVVLTCVVAGVSDRCAVAVGSLPVLRVLLYGQPLWTTTHPAVHSQRERHPHHTHSGAWGQ